jgi:endonuclease/exonuclease/phosphatase family metal-dependent hydrolase
VVVVNTHMLANYDEDWAPGNRFAREQRNDLGQLADAIGRLDPEALLIVAGDFNVPVANPLFEEFTSRCGLRDVFATASSPPPATIRQTGTYGLLHVIDHILYRHPSGQPLEATARMRFEEPVQLASGRLAFASDHLAVEAQIVLG